MICHSSLAVPSSSTLTPSSYSLNIITGEYIASYQSTSKSINFVFLLVVIRANTKILRCKQMASMLHQTDQRQKFKKAKKHQDFIKMLSCRTFEIGSTINITTSFCRVIYWDRVGTLWWKPLHWGRIHIKVFNSQPLVWVRPFLCSKLPHFGKKIVP